MQNIIFLMSYSISQSFIYVICVRNDHIRILRKTFFLNAHRSFLLIMKNENIVVIKKLYNFIVSSKNIENLN